MLVAPNNETANMLVSRAILWELNSIIMETFSFAFVENMAIDHVGETQEYNLPRPTVPHCGVIEP